MEHVLRTSGFVTVEKNAATNVIQTYCDKNIKKYEKLKRQLKSVRAQLVRPEGGLLERDRVFDKDLIKAQEAAEEGEIRD